MYWHVLDLLVRNIMLCQTMTTITTAVAAAATEVVEEVAAAVVATTTTIQTRFYFRRDLNAFTQSPF